MSSPDQTTTPAPATTTLQTITVPEGARHIARVKWFDNTLSYGFATVTSGEHAGKDIFVHQSNILTLVSGIYRTLRMGEYIEFNLEESTDTNHKYQAIAVTGPGAGQLMCESNPRRPRGPPRASSTPNNNQQASESATQPQQHRPAYRNNNGRRGYHQAPIQVVVEYPNYQRPPTNTRRPRTARPANNNTSAPASTAK